MPRKLTVIVPIAFQLLVAVPARSDPQGVGTLSAASRNASRLARQRQKVGVEASPAHGHRFSVLDPVRHLLLRGQSKQTPMEHITYSALPALASGQPDEPTPMRIALVFTGRVDGRPELHATSQNILAHLITPLRQMPGTTVDIFAHLKTELPEEIGHILRAWKPISVELYDEEPLQEFWQTIAGFGFGVDQGAAISASIQRFQWFQVFQKVVAQERRQGRDYDFIARTRPDVMYNPMVFSPNTWKLWSNLTANTAYGVCKCHRGDLVSDPLVQPAPVQDVFFVAPRAVAGRLMTMWTRMREDKSSFNADEILGLRNCYMGKEHHDYFECLTIVDLKRNGMQMQPIGATLHSMRNPKVTASCAVPFQVGGWQLWKDLTKEEQDCVAKGGLA